MSASVMNNALRLVLAATLLVCAAQAAQAPDDKMMDAIKNNKVQIFSKSYCPFCKKTKQLFANLDVDFHVDELDQMEDGAAVQQELMKLSGQRTVPNVFIGGKHVGGNDDCQRAFQDGKLSVLLKEAGVKHKEL
mmetsp:Transcript_43862/g.103274  ORF Transcript_43862/g.103274 Transcript_43862/m.103274 type:complete len:134 (-) Transcript_43862:102-503(-)